MLGDELIETEQLKKKQEKLFEQQKKFRNLQSDKKLFAEETINHIKKQKTTIDKLKKENDTLKDLIAKVNNEKNGDTKHLHNLESMKEFLNEITAAIEEEREIQKNIDIHIANFQKKIIQKKKGSVGNKGGQSESNLQKQIKILQNRLDKANQKFNETVSVNKELKLVIDSLRKERVIFDNLYKKLEGELHEKRKKMADIIEKANNAYEDRDKANNQINSLKAQAKKEASEFEKDIKEVSHLMEKIKLSSYAKKIGSNEEADHTSQHFHHDQTLNETKTNKQTKKSSEQMEKIQKFRQDFAKIEAATEIDNFQQLLRIFSKNQEKNFKMFKFVNLQSNEIEELQFEIGSLKKEMEKQEEGTTLNDKQKYLIEQEETLHSLEANLKEMESQYRGCQKEAKSITNQIERVFETIECDRQLVKEISGSKSISESNLLVFLAVIEHKATQIISTFNRLSNQNSSNLAVAKPAQVQPSILTFQDFQDNEQYDKILTAEELRKKAADFISKEQNQKQKKKEVRSKRK